MAEPTVFTQLGEAAVEVAVDKFYRLVMADPELSPLFDGIDLERLRAHQKAFVVMALGGPNKFSGRGLRNAHADLAGRIGDYEFDKVAGHLGRALSELGVDANVRASVLEVVSTTRADVLNR
jgi:hemoglobin